MLIKNWPSAIDIPTSMISSPRFNFSFACEKGSKFATVFKKCFEFFICNSAIDKIMSPGCTPALSAGEFFKTDRT